MRPEEQIADVLTAMPAAEALILAFSTFIGVCRLQNSDPGYVFERLDALREGRKQATHRGLQ